MSTAVTSTQIFASIYSSLSCASQILADYMWDNVLGHTGLQISKSCTVIVSAGMGTFLFPQNGYIDHSANSSMYCNKHILPENVVTKSYRQVGIDN